MPANEVLLKNALRNERATQGRTVTNAHADVEKELISTLNDTKALMNGKYLSESIPFILFNDLMNQYGVHGPKKDVDRTTLRSRKINRGRVVFVDFGINVGSELCFAHMAVVVANYAGIMQVVPISSYRGSIPQALQDSTVFIDANTYPDFQHDSLLLVHQMRTVDKNRIIKDMRFTIAGTPLMEELEEAVAKKVALNHNNQLQAEIARLKEENEEKDRLLEKLLAWYEAGAGPLDEVAAALAPTKLNGN